jgi:hypothetical protein
MLALSDSRWSSYTHAYGPADDIPALLSRAQDDTGPGHKPGTAWFDLWSALCHQGDTYTASYAAVPHLVQLAADHLKRQGYDPLFLTACIELARLEGRGPPIPPALAGAYREAIHRARELAEASILSTWNADADEAIRASAAALSGDIAGARAILDADLDENQSR